MLEISSFYTYVPKITIKWCMVPEIWSATDSIFCHYGPFLALLHPYEPRKSKFEKMKKEKAWIYYHFTNVYHKWQSGFPDIECNRQIFFVILDRFLHFHPLPPSITLPPPSPSFPKQLKKPKFWKTEESPCRISSLYTNVPTKSWSYAILFLRYGG